nr:cyanophycin synthetase [Micromonospora sp. DSM 115978]
SLARVPVVTFGLADTADVRATEVGVDDAGRASFDLLVDGTSHRVRLRLVGAHHVGNALAAASVASALGLDPAASAAALSAALPRSRWRMEVTVAPGGFTVVNDAYNANPESMRAALRALVDLSRGTAGGRSWAVLGPMGELGPAADDAHEALGRLVAEHGVDRLVVVGEAA